MLLTSTSLTVLFCRHVFWSILPAISPFQTANIAVLHSYYWKVEIISSGRGPAGFIGASIDEVSQSGSRIFRLCIPDSGFMFSVIVKITIHCSYVRQITFSYLFSGMWESMYVGYYCSILYIHTDVYEGLDPVRKYLWRKWRNCKGFLSSVLLCILMGDVQLFQNMHNLAHFFIVTSFQTSRKHSVTSFPTCVQYTCTRLTAPVHLMACHLPPPLSTHTPELLTCPWWTSKMLHGQKVLTASIFQDSLVLGC